MYILALIIFLVSEKAFEHFKMAATAGNRLTLDPMGNVQMPSSQKLQI
jgi:hypothetical protein